MSDAITLILQVVASGLMTGGLYALEAMGLLIIYGVLKILNLAHGELLLVGAYLSYAFYAINPLLGIALVFPVLFVMGGAIQKFILPQRVLKTITSPLIVTFGLSIILQNTFFLIFTANPVGVVTGLGSLVISNVYFPVSTLIASTVAIISLVTIHFFLTRTFLGTAIRAAARSPEDTELMGVDVRRVRLIAFILGAILAGFGGSILILQYSVDPYSGLLYTLKAFTIIVLGGFSVPGLIVAGFILGLAESFWGTYFPIQYTSAITFVVFLLVIMLRPSGLFGASEKT